jgi:replicative DNA helicase
MQEHEKGRKSGPGASYSDRGVQVLAEESMKPPHSIEAEKSVLGAVLRQADQYLNTAIDILKPEYFFFESHKLLFTIILELDQEHQPIDVVSVSDKIKAAPQGHQLSFNYLIQLIQESPISQNIEYYALKVKDYFFLRKIVDTCRSTILLATKGADQIDGLIDQIERQFLTISDQHDRGGLVMARDVLQSTLADIEERIKHQGEITGVTTGFTDLDRLISGWQKSDLIIAAARPGMGKTALGLNLAMNAAKENFPTAIFSLEMSKDQLMKRLLSGEARVDSSALVKGDLSEDDQDRIVAAARRINTLPLSIDDTPSITLAELRSRCRRFKKEHGLRLVVIDYLQLMTSSRHYDSKEREIAEISKGLKQLAKELQIAVIALAQLNRGPDSRTDKRPKASDLRESGSIEQDADQILLIYRDDYYNRNSEHAGKSEIILEKNRHGETGVVNLAWLPNFVSFHNLQRV